MSAVTARSGWYDAGDTGTCRWWDGTRWTPHRLTDAGPTVDRWAVDPPWMGYFYGCYLLVSSAVSAMLGVALLIVEHRLLDVEPTGFLVFAPWIFFILACLPLATSVFYFVGAINVGRIRRLPPPASAPMVRDVIRPLPGEQEGPGAGWYRVTGGIQRWWTGRRWSWYTASKYGPRPAYVGPRVYRIQVGFGLGIIGLGILSGITGLVLAVVYPAAAVLIVIGAIVVGGLLLITGGIYLAMTWFRRDALILPKRPPGPQSRVAA